MFENPYGQAILEYWFYTLSCADFNLFVAIGGSGTIITSPDGATWTLRTSNLTAVNGTALAFDGTTIVAVAASGKISSSTDGITWTARTSNTTNGLNGVAYNGTIFCAVGNSNAVVTSPDGITWTRQSPVFSSNANLQWITSNGTNFYTNDSNSNLFITTTGATMSSYTFWFQTLSINFINSMFIVNGTDNSFTTSNDALSWTTPANNRSSPFTWGKTYWFNAHSKYMMTQTTTGMHTSTDGVTFKGSRSTAVIDIAYSASQDKLVACGSGGNIITSVNKGLTWLQNTSLFGGSSGAHSLHGITYSAALDRFVIVSNLGGIFTSADGFTWIQSPFTTSVGASSFHSVIWVPEKTLFVAAGAVMATSPDGITWTQRTTTYTNDFLDVKYNASLNRFIACGDNCPVITSVNGTTWTVVSLPSGGVGKSSFTCIANLETGGFIIFSPATDVALFSTDGLNWIQKTIPQEATVNTSGQCKALYSSVDKCAFFFNPSSVPAIAACNLIQTSGIGTTVVNSMFTTSGRFTNLCYIPSNDTYVGVGAAGIVTFTRTYNRSTQFVLPTIPNTLIRIQ